MTTPRMTVFFIVEPPGYQIMACYLAASLRQQFGDQLQLVGYCPTAKLGDVAPEVRLILDRMGCDLRGFDTEDRFEPAYPHGNKILAALEKRDTEWSCFMDSDILCLRANSVENLVKDGHVSASMAASMLWAPPDIWDLVYTAAGMEKPEERYQLMRQTSGEPKLPYFSSGLVAFPEQYRSPEGLSFPETWMQVAQRLDMDDRIPNRRPYLDQLSLPLAIRRAGLDWNILPENQHFILGGKLRGKPLPERRKIYTVHYRNSKVLQEVGLVPKAKDMLEKFAGVRRINQAARSLPEADPIPVDD